MKKLEFDLSRLKRDCENQLAELEQFREEQKRAGANSVEELTTALRGLRSVVRKFGQHQMCRTMRIDFILKEPKESKLRTRATLTAKVRKPRNPA